jgi:Fe-S cluster biogenesis protein NfuA
MFIQTEDTPNPSTMKFIPGTDVLGNSTAQFNNKEEAAVSPLAEALFTIKAVRAVFFGSDFISVTKDDATEWHAIKTEILTTIMEHYVGGKPIYYDETTLHTPSSANAINENDDELTKQIKELIETRVRPAVAQDGGDIIFHSFENGVVKLELHGSCSGCPSSTVTLKNGIENMLKHYVPEVESVEQVML